MRIIDANCVVKLILEERDKLSPQFKHNQAMRGGIRKALRCIEQSPAIDAVSIGVYEQVRWERDVAIAQLEELGIGFGQKKPDMVKVVRCKDCKHSEDNNCPNLGESLRYCLCFDTLVASDGFCHKGKLKE